MTVPIEPQTRVGDLLEAYPEAEQILVDLAPPFAALKNPVLRRTVARVATLEQAAKVGGVPVSGLVLSLRDKLGAAGRPVDSGGDGSVDVVPHWIDASTPAKVVDADELLASGNTPLTEVNASLAALGEGEVLLVTAGFEPAPLVDAVRARGHEVHSRQADDNQWSVFIRRS